MRARDGHDRLRRAARRAGREARARRADGHRRCRSSPRPSARGRARTWTSSASAWPTAASCGCTRPARPLCGCRARRRARATRRRSRRSSPRNSASRPTTSTSCTATPTRPRSGSAPTAAARRRCPARPPRWWPARSATRPRSSPRGCSRLSVADLEWEKGSFHVKGDPTASVTIQDIAMRAHGAGDLPEGIEGGLDAQICYNPENLTYPYGAYFCVVDIDPGTAVVKVRRFLAVDDCGTRINPMIIEGQVHGGHRRRHRHGADGDDRVRRGRQLPRRLADGLPDPDRAWRCRIWRPGTPSPRRRTTRSAPRASASRPPSARRRRS